MKILIADDAKAVRQRLHELLKDISGVDGISEAANCEEAIQAFHTDQPEVVVLDIRMPGGSGIDVLRLIKQQKPSTKVLIMTNYPYPQYRDKCIQEGADHFFDKSNEFTAIASVLKAFSLVPVTGETH